MLISPQKKSLTDAKQYLRRIGVGTASNPPTATMNAALEMRWRKCASGLIDKILEYRDYLTNTPQSHVWQELRLRPENLPKAENWKKLILKLPPRDKTTSTCDRWWAVAKQMLDVTPLIDDQIKRKVKDDSRKPEKYAEREVRRAFYKLFR